jgi:hypothetical protein
MDEDQYVLAEHNPWETHTTTSLPSSSMGGDPSTLHICRAHGSRIDVVCLASYVSRHLQAAVQRLLLVLEDDLQDPRRTSAYRKLSRPFLAFAELQVLMHFSLYPLYTSYHVELRPSQVSKLSELADQLRLHDLYPKPQFWCQVDPCDVALSAFFPAESVSSLSFAEFLSLLLSQYANLYTNDGDNDGNSNSNSNSHDMPQDSSLSPPSQSESSHDALTLQTLLSASPVPIISEVNLWNLSIKEIALRVGRWQHISHVMKFFRICHNQGICRVFHRVEPTTVLAPTEDAEVLMGNALVYDSFVQGNTVPSDLTFANLRSFFDFFRKLGNCENVRSRMRRNGFAWLSTDPSLFCECVGLFYENGFLKEMQVVPLIDENSNYRDTMLGGLDNRDSNLLRKIIPLARDKMSIIDMAMILKFDLEVRRAKHETTAREKLDETMSCTHSRELLKHYVSIALVCAKLDTSIRWFVLDDGLLERVSHGLFSELVYRNPCAIL